MTPIHDVDVLLLLATSLAAKRRPAELVDVVASIDLIQGSFPAVDKVSEALVRLGRQGVLQQNEVGICLSPAAEQLIAVLPRKGDHDQRLFELRGLLAAKTWPGDGMAINVTPVEWQAAVDSYRAAQASSGKNLLVPKPKVEETKARPGQRQRRPLPKARKR